MPFAVTARLRSTRLPLVVAALAVLGCIATSEARADSAYVAQMSGVAAYTASVPVAMAPANNPAFAPRPATYLPTPETAAPNLGGQNMARTLEIGTYNRVAQIQAGRNDTSNVGIIGSRNNVGVLQGGSNLQSNLVLLGTGGLNVGVIQPAGSAPVNMLIARLPNGGLLIKR